MPDIWNGLVTLDPPTQEDDPWARLVTLDPVSTPAPAPAGPSTPAPGQDVGLPELPLGFSYHEPTPIDTGPPSGTAPTPEDLARQSPTREPFRLDNRQTLPARFPATPELLTEEQQKQENLRQFLFEKVSEEPKFIDAIRQQRKGAIESELDRIYRGDAELTTDQYADVTKFLEQELENVKSYRPSVEELQTASVAKGRGVVGRSWLGRTLRYFKDSTTKKVENAVLTATGEIAGATGNKGLQTKANRRRKVLRESMRRMAQEHDILDRSGMLPYGVASTGREATVAVGESLAAGGVGGLGRKGLATLVGWYSSTTAADSLAEADEEGRTGKAKYAPAAAHAFTEGVWTYVGGRYFGAGTGTLAEGGKAGQSLAGRAAAKLAEKHPLGHYFKGLLEVGGAAGAEVVEEVATEATHYLIDRATPSEYKGPPLVERLGNVAAVAALAGGGARGVGLAADYLSGLAETIERRRKELPRAIKEQSVAEWAEQHPETAREFADKLTKGEPISRRDFQKAGLKSSTNAPTRQRFVQDVAKYLNGREAENAQEAQVVRPPGEAEEQVQPQEDQSLRGVREGDRPETAPQGPEQEVVPRGPESRTAEVANEKTWYHGSGAEGLSTQHLTPNYTDIRSLFGIGVYLTDDPSVARGYSRSRGKKTKTPTIYQAKVNVGRVVDLESPVDPTFLKVLEDSVYEQFANTVLEAASKEGATNESVFESLREAVEDESQGDRIPLSEYAEMFQAIAGNLRMSGIDAIAHEGGKRVGKKKHEVLILLDPNDEFGDAHAPIKPSQFTEFSPYNPESEVIPSNEIPQETQAAPQTETTEQAPATGRTESVLEGPPPAQPQGSGPLPAPASASAPPAETEALGAATTGPQLSPLPTSEIKTPKSQRQIITDLAKGLKVPIRFGRLRSRFAGFYRKPAHLIGIKSANDIPVVSHEAGHAIDEAFSLSDNPRLVSELNTLGDPKTTGSRSSWTKSKSQKRKRQEGAAEFVRYWLTDPQHAAQNAPGTFAAFEQMLDANKDLGDVLRTAQDDIRVWREAEPQARLRSHVSRGDNPNKTPYTLSQLTRDLVDDLHILRLSVDDAKAGKPNLKPSEDPYLLARNLRGSFGMAETFIRSGIVDFNSKEVALGTSLEDALAPVAGRLKDFSDWIIARRAQELHSQRRETGLVPSDVDAVATQFEDDSEFRQAFDDIKAWNDALLQYAVDSGLITPESADAMRQMNQDYVPFHRLFEVGAGESPSEEGGIGSGLNVGKPGSLKGQKGSTRNIVEPLETMVKNAYLIVTASEKSAINRAIAKMADLPNMGKWVEQVAAPKEKVSLDVGRIRKQLADVGANLNDVKDDLIMSFFRPAGTAPYGTNIVRVIRDGKPKFYRLNRDLFDTFTALDLDDSGKLIRILSAPAQTLRAGVTLEPSFALANALRDTFGAAVISKYGALPFETTLRGVSALVNNPKLVSEWAASGGRSAVEASFFDRNKLQRYLAERISKDLSPLEQLTVVAKSPLVALRWLTSVAEEATRIGEYQIAQNKLLQSGMPSGEARRLAAFEARDRQDFAKGGARTKIIRHVTAFWNASLQGNVKLADSFKQRPVRTTLQGLSYVTLPTLLAMALNWDDEDYWDRPQWERDAFWLIPSGKDKDGHTRFVRIPKPFLLGVIFGTLPERMLSHAKASGGLETFPEVIVQETVPNPMPQSVQLVYETMLTGERGWNVFRDRHIVPQRLADLPSEMQFTEYTSTTAKTVGERLGISPMKIDHAINQTTGGIGKLLTGQRGLGDRFITNPLLVSNQPSEDFYTILDEMRTAAAGARAGGNYRAPDILPAFEIAADMLAELRKETRDPDASELDVAVSEDKQYRLAKQMVALAQGEPSEIPEPIVGRLAYRATGPNVRRKTRNGIYIESIAERDARREERNEEIDTAIKALVAAGIDKSTARKALETESKRRGDTNKTINRRRRAFNTRFKPE